MAEEHMEGLPRPFIIDSSHGITQNQATPALPHGINQNQATHVLPPQNTYQPPALPPINAPYSHTYSTHASSSSSAASVEASQQQIVQQDTQILAMQRALSEMQRIQLVQQQQLADMMSLLQSNSNNGN
eukprot:832694_1